MKKFLLPFFILSTILLSAQTKTPFCIGVTDTLKSAVLNENRILNIYLPQGFAKEKAYPVIYLLDGSANEDFVHISGVAQFFNLSGLMPETIVVGIANTDRKHDFTFPTKIKSQKDEFPTTGGSVIFIEFIEKELQPYIAEHYSNSATKYIIGQSLGGLLATEILLKKPQLFSHYIIVSPSLWWDEESLLKDAPFLLLNQNPKNIWVHLSVGSEGKIMEKDAADLSKIFPKYSKGLKTIFNPLPKENHATILHQAVYDAFKSLFPYKE
jgi:predicted alpha/beta superfamily hydrolase